MKLRVVKILLVIALLAAYSGCPSGSTVSIRTGTWIFDLGTFGVFAITLLPGGTAVPPDPLPDGTTTFGGSLMWSQNGRDFLMTQDNTSPIQTVINEYTGRVNSRTSMSGDFEQTVGGDLSGTWTATFMD